MDIKQNNATYNRPEGDRVIDAPYLFIDIDEYVTQLTNEKAWEKNDRNGITVFKSDQLTMVITCLQAGAEINNNRVDSAITIQVLKGNLVFSTGEEKQRTVAPYLVTFHPGIEHSIKCLDDSIILITTHKIPDPAH